MAIKYTKWQSNIHTRQMAIKYTKWQSNIQGKWH
jgi:hypothetical protein